MSQPLFSPFQLRSVVFPNRIGVSPMCEYSSEDGFANDWHLVHLGCRAQGGGAMVMREGLPITAGGGVEREDSGVAGIPGSVCRADSQRGRNANRRSGHDHRSETV